MAVSRTSSSFEINEMQAASVVTEQRVENSRRNTMKNIDNVELKDPGNVNDGENVDDSDEEGINMNDHSTEGVMSNDDVDHEDIEDDDNEENEDGTDGDESLENGDSQNIYDNDDNVENFEDADGENDEPVYDGAQITLGESMLSTLMFAMSNNLTGSAFSELLELLSYHMPRKNKFKKTAYKFHKFFEGKDTPPTKHFYCSTCTSLLDSTDAVCEECDENSEKSYFIELNISHQLKNLLQRPGFDSDLGFQYDQRVKEEEDAIEDIYDGLLYKEHLKARNPSANKYILSFMWYTDGAPVFTSRKFSVWPFYFIINELPYAKRIKKENIIVAGLWFGSMNPNANLFLQPIYTQLAILRDGIKCTIPSAPDNKSQIVKVFLLCGTGDAPARSDFMNHVRFNGKFGCMRCYSIGYNIGDDTGGRRSSHIYPYDGPLKLRQHQSHVRHGISAAQCDKPIFGVKGPSILSQMMPDVIRGCSIDVMHCVYSGVVKKLLELWLDSNNRFKPFSLYQHKDVIDSRVMELKPPNFIKRLPRSISNHINYFKASELKTWFFFYSIPVLEDLMDQEYFVHYTQLLLGIYILNQSSITVDHIEQSKQLLLAFVSKFQVLYDPKFMVSNIHALLHLPEVVEDLGPLWTTSCFPFEDLLGKMVDYVHGTRYVGLQIYTKVKRHQIIYNKLQQLKANTEIKHFCDGLIRTGKRICSTRRIGINSFILGKVSVCQQLLDELREPLSNIGVDIEDKPNIFVFHKLKKSKLTISCRQYKKKMATSSSCVIVQTEKGEKIGFAESFIKICHCDHRPCVINCNNHALFFVIFTEAIVEKPYKAPLNMTLLRHTEVKDILPIEIGHIYRMVGERSNTELINIDCISHLCFFIKKNNIISLIKPPNFIEYDE